MAFKPILANVNHCFTFAKNCYMEFSARKIAEFLGGEVVGNPGIIVNSVSKIDDGLPESLTFLANPVYEKYIYETRASVVVVNRSFVPERPVEPVLIKVDDPYGAFAQILELYQNAQGHKTGIDSLAFVSPSAQIGKDVYIGPFAYVGENSMIGNHVQIHPNTHVGDNSSIGNNSIIYSGVKIYHNCEIGSDCVIHAGVVIGSDGFGFAPNTENLYRKIPQLGNVVIEDKVEIGANSTIDRATLGSTIIRKGVKLDNLIQVAHNVEIGENTVIASQSGIAGSTRLGKNCMIGGQVGIIGHLEIADGTKIAAQSGIANSVMLEGQVIQGSPAFKVTDYQKSLVIFRRLPELMKKVEELEKELTLLRKG
jgi:UDP-3-O-[3-hydroxymyristoyl] glucosamine N-acyltransferase